MDRVVELLTPPVQAAGLVLEDVTVSPAGRRRVVRVTVDLPETETGALDLDVVADVSRAISTALDETDVLGGAPYVLEVSSPGVDRPLTEPRHWRRARTRLVTVPVGDESVTGRVKDAGETGVTLELENGTSRQVPWADLGTGRVQVEFKHVEDDEDPEEA